MSSYLIQPDTTHLRPARREIRVREGELELFRRSPGRRVRPAVPGRDAPVEGGSLGGGVPDTMEQNYPVSRVTLAKKLHGVVCNPLGTSGNFFGSNLGKP